MSLNQTLLRICGAAAFIWTSTSAEAHHAFAAEYDIDQPITIKGKLTKLEWTNPHGWIYVDVTDTDGKVINWGVEFGAPNAPRRPQGRFSDWRRGHG
jgi:hypothetical protein